MTAKSNKIRTHQFFIRAIEHGLLLRRITKPMRRILLSLAKFVDKTGFCFPSQATLQQTGGYSREASVSDAIARAVKAGYLVKIKNTSKKSFTGKNGKTYTPRTIYQFVIPAFLALAEGMKAKKPYIEKPKKPYINTLDKSKEDLPNTEPTSSDGLASLNNIVEEANQDEERHQSKLRYLGCIVRRKILRGEIESQASKKQRLKQYEAQKDAHALRMAELDLFNTAMKYIHSAVHLDKPADNAAYTFINERRHMLTAAMDKILISSYEAKFIN